MSTNASLYDRDFHAWANEQAALLRAGRLQEVDIENVAEEIESMGQSQRNQLISRLTVLLVHLLKWKYQAALQGRSWENTIHEQRRRTLRHLDKNPSLKATLQDSLHEAYEDAIGDAIEQTGLVRSTFPVSCPWPLDRIFEAGWFPE